MSEANQTVKFTVFQPNSAPLQLALPPSTITLGRASDCTIPIRDKFLSRRHAEINFDGGAWIVKDCGSVNGTLLNGNRLVAPAILKPGDRIILGDSEVVFGASDSEPISQLIQLDSDSHAKNLAIPLQKAIDEDRGRDRASVITALALELIEDRPMTQLFDFILERVLGVMRPSRAALALLNPDGKTFGIVRVRRSDSAESTELMISRTLLSEVIEERKVISFVDTSGDDKLARAESIVRQQIRSAVCAPLVVGDAVLGVLYIDYLATRGTVTEEDLRMLAQISRFAAVKLETTRLRDEAIAKAKMEDELRTAYTIQKRLLPLELPEIDGYVFAGNNKPCKTVSGDYYDVLVRPDGRIYFIIADVSGKGITAALVMSGLATAFSIFARYDPAPADLLRELNLALTPKTSPSKFATVVVGVLDPSMGTVDFANAGHVPPLFVTARGVFRMEMTDMVVGLFENATYRNQYLRLEPGDSLVLFTDGVTEAENEAEDQLGLEAVADLLRTHHRRTANSILDMIDVRVQEFCGAANLGDDVTMLAISRT
jgi:sigma-B regulation protein RsbU (phosphoserine phosphatase)